MGSVSIIMPAYNAEKTIGASIRSVFDQDYKDWQLIIIDDNSTDKTMYEIEKEITCTTPQGIEKRDSRVTLIYNWKNMGVSFSRNSGIESADNEILAFLDADDIWEPDKLTKQLQFMEETGAAISYTATAYMNAQGARYSYILRAERELYYEDLLRQNLMSCSSVMVRKDKMVPFPNEDFPHKRKIDMHEDYVAWLTIVRKEKCAYGLDEPLLIYRMSRNSKSGDRISSAEMIFHSYREVGYDTLTALGYTLRYALHSVRKRLRIMRNGQSDRKA